MLSLPAWEGPDEPSHFIYVEALAEEHRLPAFGTDSYSPAMAAVIDATHFSWLDWLSQPVFVPGQRVDGDLSRHQANPTSKAGAYSPLYYAAAVPFYELGHPWGVLGSLYAIRFFDLLLGTLAVYFTVVAGRALWPANPSLGVVAGGLLAFQPMFDQGTTMVNNDAATYAIGAAFVAAVTLALRRPPSWRWGLLVGGLAGLGFAVKPTAAMLLLAAAFWFAIRLLFGSMRSVLLEGAGLAAGMVATGGAWMLLGGLTARGLTAQIPGSSTAAVHSLGSYLLLLVNSRLHYLFRAWVDWLWGNFAWLNTPLPMAILLLIEAIVLVLGFGVGLWLWRRLWRRRRNEPLAAQVLLLAAAVLGGIGFLHATDAFYYLRTGSVLLQGRYLLVLGGALVLLLLVGARALVPARFGVLVSMSLFGGMVALNILSIGVLWQRFYA